MIAAWEPGTGGGAGVAAADDSLTTEGDRRPVSRTCRVAASPAAQPTNRHGQRELCSTLLHVMQVAEMSLSCKARVLAHVVNHALCTPHAGTVR